MIRSRFFHSVEILLQEVIHQHIVVPKIDNTEAHIHILRGRERRIFTYRVVISHHTAPLSSTPTPRTSISSHSKMLCSQKSSAASAAIISKNKIKYIKEHKQHTRTPWIQFWPWSENIWPWHPTVRNDDLLCALARSRIPPAHAEANAVVQLQYSHRWYKLKTNAPHLHRNPKIISI